MPKPQEPPESQEQQDLARAEEKLKLLGALQASPKRDALMRSAQALVSLRRKAFEHVQQDSEELPTSPQTQTNDMPTTGTVSQTRPEILG